MPTIRFAKLKTGVSGVGAPGALIVSGKGLAAKIRPEEMDRLLLSSCPHCEEGKNSVKFSEGGKIVTRDLGCPECNGSGAAPGEGRAELVDEIKVGAEPEAASTAVEPTKTNKPARAAKPEK